jgi:hypothetical protein
MESTPVLIFWVAVISGPFGRHRGRCETEREVKDRESR